MGVRLTRQAIEDIRPVLETDRAARKALAPWREGRAAVGQIGPTVRRLADRMANDPYSKLNRTQRARLLDFVAAYPLPENAAKNEEPLSIRMRIRVSETMKREILGAAKRAGEKESEYLRRIVMERVRQDLQERKHGAA